MAQGCAAETLAAYDSLPEADKDVLSREMARTGIPDQHYDEREIFGPEAPALLLYYGPAWLQRAGAQHAANALRVLVKVYDLARELWPFTKDACAGTVII